MRFFAVTGATVVGMSVAGKLVREGGIRLAYKAEQYATKGAKYSESVNSQILSYKKVQQLLDELQGIEREAIDSSTDALIVRDKDTGRLIRNSRTNVIDDFNRRQFGDGGDPWTWREELQQRLVGQARRLPYEVPGMYLAQKAVIDPLLGTNEDRRKVNWTNPFDVVGDFAYQSVKSLGLNVLPFEGAVVAGKSGFRGLMKTLSDPNAGPGVMTVNEILKYVGAGAEDILNKTMKYSQSSMGAFASLVEDTKNNGKTFRQWVRQNSTSANGTQVQGQNSQFARRLFNQVSNKSDRQKNLLKALDTLPGPFRGMASSLGKVGTNFKTHNKIYDMHQQLLSGTKTLAQLRQQLEPNEYAMLMGFMKKGGGSLMEQYATQSFHLGDMTIGKMGDNIHPNFYGVRRNIEFKNILIDELEKSSGLKKDVVQRFVSMAERVSPLAGSRAPYPGGDNLMERFKFLSNRFHGDLSDFEISKTKWWDEVVLTAQKNRVIGSGHKDLLSFEAFQTAVNRADGIMNRASFKDALRVQVEKDWKMIHGQMIPDMVNESIPAIKKPFEFFQGSYIRSQEDFLIRRSSQRLGIRVSDDAGNARPLNDLKRELDQKGYNPNNLEYLRGFLVSKKDIQNPYSMGNIFGFRSMSIHEALVNGYYGANPIGVQKEIEYLTRAKTMSPTVGRGGNMNLGSGRETIHDLKMSGVYIGPNGRVLDFSKMGRRITQGFEQFADNYQVPLLHFNPLKIFGSSNFKTWRNTPPIMFAPGESVQLAAMRGGEEFAKPSYYMWMKTSAKTGKGKLFGVDSNLLFNTTTRNFGNNMRPLILNENSMMGIHGRIFAGHTSTPGSAMHGRLIDDNGNIIDDPNDKTPNLNKFKRRFSVSDNQEGNFLFGRNSAVGRWWRALRKKPDGTRQYAEAYQNPYRAAELLGRKDFDIRAYAQAGNAGAAQDLSEGLSRLTQMSKDTGIPKSALREFANDLKLEGIDINDIDDLMLPTVMERVLKKDLAGVANPSDRQVLSAMQKQVRNLLRQGSADKYPNFWQLPVTGSKSVTVTTRIDELRNEIGKYLIAKQTVGTPQSLDMGSMLSKVDEMFKTGIISSAEKAEARAAVLGMKIDESYRKLGYRPDSSLLSRNIDAFEQVLADPAAREVFEEIGRFSIGNQGRFSPVRSFFRRRFAEVPYEAPYQPGSPTGSNVFFVPTFTEAFRNNPRKAIKGALGGSWRDPESISGGSMPAAHMALRLNRYFELFGMGLDPLDFKGPLDFYARGIIGKRVLPIYAAGSTALAVDRTLGGMVREDEQGNPIYSPLVLGTLATGVAQGQAAIAGLVPGGQTYEEKMEELERGEVPVRQGRFWFLGNTPFKGGRIQYFRPSWYNRLKSGATFAPEMNETPLERLAFGSDFSPLKLIDPYRREREDYYSRPYPITGDYFTGPWGPLSGVLNATIGKVLKPPKLMHKEEMKYALQQYLPVGESGAYLSGSPVTETPPRYSGEMSRQSIGNINMAYQSAAMRPYNTPSSAPLYGSLGFAPPRGRASEEVRMRATQIASSYQSRGPSDEGSPTIYESLSTYGVPSTGVTSRVPFGVPTAPGLMQPRIIAAQEPIEYGTTPLNLRRIGYQTQELLGIYGFSAASMRESLGMGTKDFAPDRAILEPASRGYSASRSFWNLNLGGLGDLPLPIEGKFSNFELSEIIRRFVPKEPAGTNYINPLPNLMGQQYPWLPGSNYPLASVKMGDPYNAVPEAEIRLPGTGYMRTHQLYPDRFGALGAANIHDILGDIAPWSQEYKSIDKMIASENLTTEAAAKVRQTRAQVEAMRYKNEFTPYEYKYKSPSEMLKSPLEYSFGRFTEWLAHRDTYFNTKFLPTRTALEDWERDNVYGATFPTWESPIESFIKPSLYKSTQRNPVTAALAGGTLGSLFGSNAQSRAIGSLIGGALGVGSSVYGKTYEAVTGERYIPGERRKQLALEENIDILDYTRSVVNASRAVQAGNMDAAQFFAEQSKKTMYGADLNATPEQLAMAVPKRKREHFRAMLYAPEQEREDILSTAPRLERRLLQAAWGMPVEQRPNLEEYFQEHELPPPDSEIWSPLVNMDSVKIKMGQSIGIDMSQMGFYPQQIKEANLVNPSYPEFNRRSSTASVRAQIQRLIYSSGGAGSVSFYPTPFGDSRSQLTMGV